MGIPTQNLHTHTTYVDGHNSPAEMADAAIAAGLDSLGFSEHAHAWFDNIYTMSTEQMPRYKREIAQLREQYRGKLEIFVGMEIDFADWQDRSGCDYVIGSAHWFSKACGKMAVDDKLHITLRAIDELFGGDPLAAARDYYDQIVAGCEAHRPEILGHFDLITKFDEDGAIFGDCREEYLKIAKEALDAAAPFCQVIEVNTGGISRGYCRTPYPRRPLLEHIFERGYPITITSDSHAAETVTFAFAETTSMLREIGFAEWMKLTPEGFVPQPLG